jgi:LDH2 family malate/lactate/ureidoglycolate dehydrogenase
MVDLLAGLLSDAAYVTDVQAWDKNPGVAQNLGDVFVLIDVARLGGTAWLHERMEDFRAILTSTPAADPDVPVMATGARELAAYARQRRDGVSVLRADLDAVAALAG